MSGSAKLTRGSVRGHLVGQTAPGILGVAAIVSVGVVDAYFVGQLGTAELAAISFASPVLLAVTSLGIGIMAGLSSVVSRALGEGADKKAHQRGNLGIALALVCGLLLAGALVALRLPLFRLMQAGENVLPIIDDYMFPIALGLPLLLLQMGVNGVLRGQGAAKRSSAVLVIFAIANWILDPILITGVGGFGGFGVAGAAYASIAGWGLASLGGLWLLRSTQLPFDPRALKGSEPRKTVPPILKVAVPAAFANAINPIGLSVLTGFIAAQGSAAVAGFGAGGRLQAFMLVPLLAMSGAIGSIVGQNWGASEYGRARSAWMQAAVFAVLYALAIALVLFFARDWFAGFFSEDAAVVREFNRYLAISVWGYAGFGVLIITNGAFNAIDRANTSLAQSAARVFLVMVPVAWFTRGAMGADAIYYGELAANLAGGALAAFLAWRLLKHRE